MWLKGIVWFQSGTMDLIVKLKCHKSLSVVSCDLTMQKSSLHCSLATSGKPLWRPLFQLQLNQEHPVNPTVKTLSLQI